MKHRFGSMSPRKKISIAGCIVLYTLIMVGFLVWVVGDEEKPQSIYGSMDDRFLSETVMVHNGETYYYRENEITNYLVIGLDRQDINQVTGYQNGGQADFLVVLSIDRVRRTVTPIMLDRDTMVMVQTYGVFGHPSGTRQMQICLSHAYSGTDVSNGFNTVASVEALLHEIKIQHYITLDISAVSVLNDALGGVEVTLQDDFSAFDPTMVSGATILLNGQQAEFFVRGRLTVADGTNASRMRRQQQYIDSFLEQLQQEMDKDSNKLNEMLQAVSEHMETDTNQNRLLRDINSYDNYEWMPLRTLEGTHTIDRYGFAEFWVEEDYLRDLIADIWFAKKEELK